MSRAVYREWYPQVWLDEHQMGSTGPRIFVPPYSEPVDADIHPLVWREVNLIGSNMALRLEQAGKSGVTVKTFPDQNGANLAISSGKAELGMADSPVAAYIVEQSDGQFKLGEAYGVAPYGIALTKGSGLVQPTLDAVKALYDDGTMQKIFDYWQLPDAAIDTPAINGAIS